MKKALILFYFFVITAVLVAQSVTVKGKLVSESDKTELPYATVTVASEATPANTVKKMATQQDGTFSTTLPPGKYILSFHYVGMNDLEKSIEVSTSQDPIDMGAVAMTETSMLLEEVSVTAQKPLVKVEIDKLTYSAKDDPEASTSNVLDLLRKVPLVTVDGEDEIQLKGSSSFKIYLNGKPSNMISGNPSQVLKSMPASSIKDIEVITDPGAKYDAEGIGGIINIITDKRADDGYSGSVGANGDTFGGYGGNAYLATKYGKFGFTGNAGYYHHASPVAGSSFIREETATDHQSSLTQNGSSESSGGGLFLTGAVSFEPDTVNLFNLSLSRFGGEFSSLSLQDASSIGSRAYTYNTRSNSISHYGGMNLSADYQHSFRRMGEMLTTSYRYEYDPNDSEYDSEYNDVTGMFYYPDGYQLKSLNNAGGREHTIQIDYVNPLNGKHSIETGMKYIFRDNSSRADHTFFDVEENRWKPDLNRKNDLDHSQYIASGYAGYSFKTGKMGLKVGLRGEQTNQEIHFMSNELDTIVKTNFFDMVPSVALSYQLGMTQTLRGGYNMRISRPGIWYLNPYINDVDPNNISYGNPRLDAEQQHNFNLNYGTFSQKLNFNATLSYSFAKNAVTSYSFIREGVTHSTYDNIGRNQSVGTNLYVSWTPVQMIRTYINGGVNYTDIQSTEDRSLRNSGFSGRAFGGLTFTFPNDFRVGVNGGTFMSRVQLQTKQSPFYVYSFSMMKSFLDKKLDVSLNMQNLFSEHRIVSSTTTGDGFWQESVSKRPVRNLRLSVTYRFGDLKTSMKKVQRGIINEDVLEGESNQQQGTTTTPTGD
ncbi:MAG: TonB-dependent receptor [Proteiniphilum sp.]|nr:TonB-dependent receptor [Proteiniphilum sp.]